jgi:hypothetical protein
MDISTFGYNKTLQENQRIDWRFINVAEPVHQAK